MRKILDILTEGYDDPIRDGRHLVGNPEFDRWFEGSRVVTSDGHPMMMFHASMSNDIEVFDPDKIREADLDAPFNGFWFSSDPQTQPAWCSMDKLITVPVFLSIKNPASWQVWRKVVREVNTEWQESDEEDGMNPIRQGARSTHDEVRFRLQDMGYDGIVWEKSPKIDRLAFKQDGRHEYRDERGYKYWIEKGQHEETEWRETERTIEDVYLSTDGKLEKVHVPSPSSVVAKILEILGWWDKDDGSKPDWSQYDMEAMKGSVTLGDKTVEVKKIPRKYMSRDPHRTGKFLDTVELYNNNGHVTGYNDLDDFLDSSKHETWIAFTSTQIKSVYNKGTWSSSNPKITESQTPQWNAVLEDADEIAAYIQDTSVNYIDYDLCRENFRGCHAVLRWVPIEEIKDTHAAHHDRVEEREIAYSKLPLDTMPPIILDRGTIEDGHHRYRVAKAANASGMWAYVIED